MSECPNAKPLYPDLKIPLAKRLAELESLAPSEQVGVKLGEAGLAMELLLDRIENAEVECAVDDTKNPNEEFERINALQAYPGPTG
ncbi:hypothetical protein AAVH_24607 [Aphelenchoides avenae]|nr:hypothetical protein AAVH_24607 [Aphelenchus avenae]